MVERHFAFFRQRSGEYVREWKGPVQDPPSWVVRLGWQSLLNRWATKVSRPRRGEIGIDVTHVAWPVGDFCYSRFDEINRLLEWGPPRRFIEIRLDTLEVVSNWESHRPVRDAVPGQHVIDITGTWLDPHFGRIWGQFVRQADGRWGIVPQANTRRVPALVRQALAEAAIDLDLAVPSVTIKEAVR